MLGVKFFAWLNFSGLKITNILKSGWVGLEKSELPWEHNLSWPTIVHTNLKTARRAFSTFVR